MKVLQRTEFMNFDKYNKQFARIDEKNQTIRSIFFKIFVIRILLLCDSNLSAYIRNK